MNKPFVSIVIPTCDRPDLLARCLMSLESEKQTAVDSVYEIIVTDDGVSSAKQMIETQFPRVLWTPGPRRGPASNRNCATRIASGEWIAFVDDDCVPSTGWIAGLLKAIEPGFDVYEGCTTCAAGVESPLFDAPINLSGGWLWSCNFMIRRSRFEQIGGFDESFPFAHMEDTDLRERLKAIDTPIKFVSDAVVDHPPKRRPFGERSGAMQECEVLYWFKTGNKETMCLRLLFNILRARMQRILVHKWGRESLIAVESAARELLYVAIHCPQWERKYRVKYANKP